MKLRRALKEALLLAAAAAALGVLYTSVVNKGFFAAHASAKPADAATPLMISFEEAASLYGGGQAVFIDARHPFEYKAGHIKGAVNLPLAEFDMRKAQLNQYSRERLLVIYCDGAQCNSSIDLAVKLTALGFSQVRIFFGGWQEWQQRSQPMESEGAARR